MPEEVETNGPDQKEVVRITNIIVAQLGGCDLESALTVVCGLAGQLVAELSEGRPSGVKAHTESIAENIKRAAITKLLYDDDKKRGSDEQKD